LQGTNAEEAKKLLSESDVSIIPADGMKDAAKKAVNATINKG
jgi:succinyl-CoA synthetase beta subunit